MKKITCFKLKFSCTRAGRSRKEHTNTLCSKLNVNEEYKQAFRTNSYTEIWSKVQLHLRKTRTSFDQKHSSSSSSSSSSCHLYMHLSDYLLEPKQDSIESINNLHHLLINYFEASLEACNICELILQSIHQTRSNYRIINRVIKLTKRVHQDHSYDSDPDRCRIIFGELTKFSLLNNPLSVISPVQFHNIHNSYKALLCKLTSKHKKIKRKAKCTRFCKKVAEFSLIISYIAFAIALLVFAFHSMVGIVAAPGLVAFSSGLLRNKRIFKVARGRLEAINLLERFGAQLDIAAKGVYILIHDFDTMSRLMGRLHDEVEHSKAIAEMCVKNNGKLEVLTEVVKEFHLHEPCFMEQLEELEDHIYLCFLTINRSRRLVIEEIVAPQ